MNHNQYPSLKFLSYFLNHNLPKMNKDENRHPDCHQLLTAISKVFVGSQSLSTQPKWLTPASTQQVRTSGNLGAAATSVDFILPGVRVKDLVNKSIS